MVAEFPQNQESQNMGEIKSTLDLVMEKTRHLTLSADEKREQNLIEVKKVFKGLLQKYQDDLLPLDRLKEQVNRLQNSSPEEIDWMRNELLNLIDLDRDNTPWMTAVREIFGFDTSALEAGIKEYQQALGAAEEQRIVDVKQRMIHEYNISGSAVLPNIEADTHWKDEKAEIQARFRERLDRKKLSE